MRRTITTEKDRIGIPQISPYLNSLIGKEMELKDSRRKVQVIRVKSFYALTNSDETFKLHAVLETWDA